MSRENVRRSMSSYPVAYFKCDDCGVKARSDIIEYDDLGYPVCPACGTRRRPDVRRPDGRRSGDPRSGGRRSEA